MQPGMQVSLPAFPLPSKSSKLMSNRVCNEAYPFHPVSSQNPNMGSYQRENKQLAQKISKMLDPIGETDKDMVI